MTKLANGTPVVFKYADKYVNCIVTGIANTLPNADVYILTVYEPDAGVAILSKDYPYESFIAHESQFEY